MKPANPLASMDALFIKNLLFRQVRNICVPPEAAVRITIVR